jgi:hypothetical protein
MSSVYEYLSGCSNKNDYIETFNDIQYEYRIIRQEGGKRRKIKIEENEYIIDIEYGEIERNDMDGIRSNEQKKKIIIINLNEEYREQRCGVMLIDNKNMIGEIRVLTNNEYCVYCDKKREEYKVGDIIMKSMIKYGRKIGLKKIRLLDVSTTRIKKNRYLLNKLRIMTRGETYYNKYGFYEVDDVKMDNKIYKYNKERNKKVKVGEINFVRIIKERCNMEEINKNKIEKFIQETIRDREIKLSEFIIRTIEEYDDIYSKIYMDIYEKAGYKNYTTSTYIKEI